MNWLKVKKNLSFIACCYMNNIANTKDVMYNLVRNYHILFPQDNIFHFLNPDDNVTEYLLSWEIAQSCREHHKKIFPDVKLSGIRYFELKPLSCNTSTEHNYQWVWKYSKTDKSAYHQFIDEWVTILETKYQKTENIEKIEELLETYIKEKRDLAKVLNNCLRESNNLVRNSVMLR